MNPEILELEIKRGRDRLTLRKVMPGELLQAVHGAASFFYEVAINGAVRSFTNDPEVAQAVWRGCHRWLLTGRSATAEVLP